MMDKTKRIWWLFGLIVLLVIALWMGGCANQSGLVVKIDSVNGDFWARKVGSNNQQVDTGQSTLSANTAGIDGIPPVGIDWSSRMQAKSSRIEIKNVSGSVYFESAASDNQGIDVPKVLEKVYIPGDPFRYDEWTPVSLLIPVSGSPTTTILPVDPPIQKEN